MLLLVLLVVVQSFLVSTLPTYCEQDKICIHSIQSNQSTFFYIFSAEAGWAALGVGSSMNKALLVVGFKNKTGDTVISLRNSTGHNLPLPIASVPPKVMVLPVPSWAKLSFSFILNVKPNDSYIWAHSPNGPFGDTYNSTFSIHSAHGKISNIDFTKAPPKNSTLPAPIITLSSGAILDLPPNVSYKVAILLHAWFMVFAWMMMPFIGIFIARFMKERLGVWWLRIHTMIFVCGVAIPSIGSVIMLYLFNPPPHFSSVHSIMGLLITIILILFLILGIACEIYDSKKPEAQMPDIISQVHMWTGRLLVVFAFINIILGIVLYKELTNSIDVPLLSMTLIFVVLGLGTLIAGQYMLKKEDAMEKTDEFNYNNFKNGDGSIRSNAESMISSQTSSNSVRNVIFSMYDGMSVKHD